MKKTKTDELTAIIGFPPNKELKKMILATAKQENISVTESASRWQLPDIIIQQNDEPVKVEDIPGKKTVIISRR